MQEVMIAYISLDGQGNALLQIQMQELLVPPI